MALLTDITDQHSGLQRIAPYGPALGCRSHFIWPQHACIRSHCKTAPLRVFSWYNKSIRVTIGDSVSELALFQQCHTAWNKMAHKKNRGLLIQHLEAVSWKVMEQYPEIIKDMIRGKSGVYALYRRDKLYYVGLASNLMGRLKAHLKDRHQGSWDRFSVYLTKQDDHIKELESLLLRIVAPTGNRQSGKFLGSENLYSTLNKNMKVADADRRAKIIGGHVARRRTRQKTKKGKGTSALAGVVERSVRLLAWHNGWEYRANLRKDGTISYSGEVYDSPSAAARKVTGRSYNGWAFWHFRDKSGNWVQLRELRR